MRTLFSDKIFSPSPSPVAIVTPDPLALHFSASSFHNSASYTASHQNSPDQQDEWLTLFRQSQQLYQRLAAERGDSVDDEIGVVADRRGSRVADFNQKGIPKVLIMGLSRSGKSSIQHVILKTKSAGETLYLEPTNQIVESATLESFIKLECVEVPSNLNFLAPGFNHEAIFGSAGSVVWVIDIQDENIHSINKLISTATFLMTHYPRINFEVFVHKTDGLSDEYKNNTVRDVRQNIEDELNDRGFSTGRGLGAGVLAFHSTSIYDTSVFEAMSKVVQRLLPQLPALEALLTKLCSKCSMQKVYLFDTTTRIYLATDASPTFLRDFEVCSEYVDMIVDAKNIYGWRRSRAQNNSDQHHHSNAVHQRAAQHQITSGSDDGSGSDTGDHAGYPPQLTSSDTTYDSHDDDDRLPDSFTSNSPIDSPHSHLPLTASSNAGPQAQCPPSDAPGESCITMNGSQDLYMIGREISDYLTLICIMGQGSTPDRKVLIDYNVSLAADAVREIFRLV